MRVIRSYYGASCLHNLLRCTYTYAPTAAATGKTTEEVAALVVMEKACMAPSIVPAGHTKW